jgi:hypothetical protein
MRFAAVKRQKSPTGNNAGPGSILIHPPISLQISTGAQDDLEKITRIAYSTVAVYGMNKKIGLVSFPPDQSRFDKPYSDATARAIDLEARLIINKCYENTLSLLQEKKDLVEALAQVGFFPWWCLLSPACAAQAMCLSKIV